MNSTNGIFRGGTLATATKANSFATQGGVIGYFSEIADLTQYLIGHSETPDLTERDAQVEGLLFPFIDPQDIYTLVGQFYITRRPLRAVTSDRVGSLIRDSTYYLNQEDGKLRLSEVRNFTGTIANL